MLRFHERFVASLAYRPVSTVGARVRATSRHHSVTLWRTPLTANSAVGRYSMNAGITSLANSSRLRDDSACVRSPNWNAPTK